MPNSYILNKVNFQQKKKDRKKKKEPQIQIELHQNVKKKSKLNNIRNVKKKIEKKRRVPSKKPKMCTIKYSMFKI